MLFHAVGAKIFLSGCSYLFLIHDEIEMMELTQFPQAAADGLPV
jgi:hypothetical protein